MTTPAVGSLGGHAADFESVTPPRATISGTSTPGRSRETLSAALGFLAIVVVLFHRLFLGEVLSPAANLWAAGYATVCLGRRLGMAATGAFVAGCAWMLSVFLVRWLLWNHSASAALLPVVLVTLDALIERASLRRLAWAGLAATALQ